MSSPRFLRVGADTEVIRIALARPPLNILTLEMLQEMNAALAEAAEHPALKVLVIEAEGTAFCAGVAVEDHLGARVRPMLEAFHEVFRRLRQLPCLTLAAVQGAALGGGAELATFCDVVLASDGATIGQPEIKLGVFPPIAALHYPRRIGVARTLALLLSGDVLRAPEAERIGLVDRVVPRDQFAGVVETEIARFRKHSAAVLRLAKRAVLEAVGRSFEEALPALEDLYLDELMTTSDVEEGLQAFVEKRKPVWKDR